MSYVSPHIKEKFESMPLDLKNTILARNVHLENMNDLMSVLEQIIAEGEGRGCPLLPFSGCPQVL